MLTVAAATGAFWSEERATVSFYSGGEEVTSLEVEVANTEEQRQKGLMNRETLLEGEGMIFVFEDEAPRGFWMKNTTIPLDMIFVDGDGEILNIEEADPEPGVPDDQLTVYRSDGDAKYVVEANQGFSEENSLDSGDSIEIFHSKFSFSETFGIILQ